MVLNARPSNEASASFAELEAAYPDRVTAVYGSVAESATATAIAQNVMARHKRLDILVNNAGILRDKLIGMISDAEIDELFNVNVIGLIKITQLAARIMTRRRADRSSMSRRLSGKGKQRPDRLFGDQVRRHWSDFFRRQGTRANEHSRQCGGAGSDRHIDDQIHPRGQTQEPEVAHRDGSGRQRRRTSPT